MTRYLPLICLSLTHTLVDTAALLIAPLWPRLERHFALGVAGLSLAFIVQSMPTSVSQVVFGYLRDRRPTPVWLWLGPAMAAAFLTLIGQTTVIGVLFAVLILGGIGVGAFHPEAAVTAGRLFPEQRTRALSMFLFGGSLGLALGPTLSGTIVHYWGLEGLAWLGPPIILLVLVLHRVGRLGEISSRPAEDSRPLPISRMLEGRGRLALFVLVICTLRLVPNMAMDKVLSFALSRRGLDELQIGLYQSVFLASASAGMFLMALKFRSGWERPFLIGCPLVGIPLLGVLGLESCPPWLFLVALVLTGLSLWGTTPAMVSYAQQMFPNGAGLASAITMGLSWGLATLVQAPITAWFSRTDTAAHIVPQQAFHAFIPCLAVAAIGAWFLPVSEREPTGDSAEAETPRPLIEVRPEPADA